MKLHLKRLDLELHGDIAPATAQEAARLLGPALAEVLNSAQPVTATGPSLKVAAQVDASSLAQQLARQLAPQLASRIRSRGLASPATRPVATTIPSQPTVPQRPVEAPTPESKRRN